MLSQKRKTEDYQTVCIQYVVFFCLLIKRCLRFEIVGVVLVLVSERSEWDLRGLLSKRLNKKTSR